jgi:hypothetical protein
VVGLVLAEIEIPVRSRVGWDGGEVELMELLRVLLRALLVAEDWTEGTTEPTEEAVELAEEATEVEEGTAELPVAEGTAELEKLTVRELKEGLLADCVFPTEPVELAEVAEAAMLLDLNDAESGLLLHFAHGRSSGEDRDDKLQEPCHIPVTSHFHAKLNE